MAAGLSQCHALCLTLYTNAFLISEGRHMAEDNATSDNTDSQLLDELQLKARDLALGAKSFSSAWTRAFSMSIVGGKQFDDVLKSLGLRLSDIALKIAFRPLERALS